MSLLTYLLIVDRNWSWRMKKGPFPLKDEKLLLIAIYRKWNLQAVSFLFYLCHPLLSRSISSTTWRIISIVYLEMYQELQKQITRILIPTFSYGHSGGCMILHVFRTAKYRPTNCNLSSWNTHAKRLITKSHRKWRVRIISGLWYKNVLDESPM